MQVRLDEATFCFPKVLGGSTRRAVQLVGDTLVRLVTCPMPTTNDRFYEAFGWTPTHPTIQEGVDQVTDQWRETGLLERREEGYEWTGAEPSPRYSEFALQLASQSHQPSVRWLVRGTGKLVTDSWMAHNVV